MQTETLFRATRLMTVVTETANRAADMLGLPHPSVLFQLGNEDIYVTVKAGLVKDAEAIADRMNALTVDAPEEDAFSLHFATSNTRAADASYRLEAERWS